MNQFKRRYPNADLSRFYFDTITLNEEGDVSADVYFINGDDYIDIASDQFKNNKNYTKCLYSKIGEQLYPKIWLGSGTIQPLQKGVRHSGSYNKWIGKTTGVYTETWPKL